MDQEKIKEAFAKVKQDILNLQGQIQEIKRTLDNATIKQQTPTQTPSSTDTSTHISPPEALKQPNSNISIGNEGVSTDRQTIRQTDTNSQKFAQVQEQTPIQTPSTTPQENIQKLPQLLDSLDNIKEDLKAKFRSLTQQEFLVYSTIYQLQEQGKQLDYPLLSKTLNLSESSIRDYIQRSLKKGVPLDKIKENNKKITLKIPQDFIKLASLQTILEIREK
tara:strand:- start:1172 stop:1831 length:660 start_codon:yes stop_codon:yes gene_type:complete